MASGSHNTNSPPPPSSSDDEPIPLQDLSYRGNSPSRASPGSIGRQRSLLHGSTFGAGIGERISSHLRRNSSYEKLHARGRGRGGNRASDGQPPRRPPPVPDLQAPQYSDDAQDGPTASQFREGFEEALGSDVSRGSWLPPRNLDDPVPGWRAGREEEEEGGGGSRPEDEEDNDDVRGREDDRAPLASPTNQQPVAGFSTTTPSPLSSSPSQKLKRTSTHSVRFAPGTSLGDDLQSVAEQGMSRTMSTKTTGGGGGRSRSGSSATGGLSRSSSRTAGRSLSPASSSPVRRVSVAVQNMGQRVVNLSNDPAAMEQSIRRKGSSKQRPDRPEVPEIEVQQYEEPSEEQEEKPSTPLRRVPSKKPPWREQANPLKGKTLRLFSPSNRLRLILCDVLIHP